METRIDVNFGAPSDRKGARVAFGAAPRHSGHARVGQVQGPQVKWSPWLSGPLGGVLRERRPSALEASQLALELRP